MDQENLVIREQRVLVVDDDPVNVEIFRTILDDQCRMFVAGDGPAALAMAERERPDIVLLDVMMPGMSGLEVCRAIRMRDSLRFTKIILVSARGSLEERLEGYRAGADDYLIKPFDWSELLAKIKVFSRLKFMEEMDELKGDFVTVLAHETRTPLTRIIGAVSVLSQLCDRPDAKPFLEMVEVSSQKLRRMLERTLLILSFRAPGSEGPIEVFPIEDALAHTWADRADLALGAFREKTKVAFHRPHLEMALTALRGFAERWQDEGGKIRLECRTEPRRWVLRLEGNAAPAKLEGRTSLFDLLEVADVEHHGGELDLDLPLVQAILQCYEGSLDLRQLGEGRVRIEAQLPREAA
ncbi:MAG: hybrid sensor histidine kinase/response regulator [Candidatus Eisenbacteria bacterium]|uniref:Hybrid sensor histidine kinase/response regulator n=1 Tax=Eiseniibacteriota bacterium TaxID=2212470 RepID=A0A956LX59_UNCEI|nr:hybrid sensor histidine kinase/response regulator [Candidatus Eisenbacteria bacterium]